MTRALCFLIAAALAACTLAGCGSAPSSANADPAPARSTVTAPAPVPDHTAVLPKKNQVSERVVPDHILDVPKLPGGSLGEYKDKNGSYQIFVIDPETNQKAAFLLLDLKATLQGDPAYLANMGGYFGSDGKRNIYMFAKKHYLAGVVGLPQAAADPIAIELASHLN